MLSRTLHRVDASSRRQQLLRQCHMRRVGLLGFPEDRNSSFLRGAASAPPLIREALRSPASNQYSETGVDVAARISDFGDLPRESSGRHDHPALLDVAQPSLSRIVSEGLVPVVVGGDHSITYAVLRSIVGAGGRPPPVIVHFDAHPDIYDSFEGSRSSHACQFARICEESLAAGLVSIGVRTLTPTRGDRSSASGCILWRLGTFLHGARTSAPCSTGSFPREPPSTCPSTWTCWSRAWRRGCRIVRRGV